MQSNPHPVVLPAKGKTQFHPCLGIIMGKMLCNGDWNSLIGRNRHRNGDLHHHQRFEQRLDQKMVGSRPKLQPPLRLRANWAAIRIASTMLSELARPSPAFPKAVP